jgi:hypothetical protein
MIWINAVAVLVHLVVGLLILRRERIFTVLFGYAFFLQTWSLLSCFYNDCGIYNFELFRYTFTTLATTRLALFYVVFNLGFMAVARLLRDRPMVRRDYRLTADAVNFGNIKLMAYLFGLVLCGYIVYSFATGGVPILEGIQKVTFYREAGPVERFLLAYGFLIAFLLGYFRRKRGRVSINGLLLAAMLVYLILTGNKFSALIKVLVFYYAAVFVQYLKAHPDFTIFRAKYVGWGVAVVLVLLSVSYGSYLYWGESVNGAADLLVNRVLALQGHLWWSTDLAVVSMGQYDPAHWLAELRAVIDPGAVAEGAVGMKYVMLQAVGPERAFAVFDTGYLYTMAYPAILVWTLPYLLAVMVQFLAGAVFAALLYYLHYSITYRHFIRAAIMVTIVLPYLAVLGTGDLYVILTPGIGFKLLLLLLLEIGFFRTATVAGVGDRGSGAPASPVAGKKDG